jgi:hypothetical protein
MDKEKCRKFILNYCLKLNYCVKIHPGLVLGRYSKTQTREGRHFSSLETRDLAPPTQPLWKH